MIELVFTGAVPFPWKSMKELEPEYKMIWIDVDCMLTVKHDGLTKWMGGQQVASGQFIISTGKFGECPLIETGAFCPVTKRLMDAFREVGAKSRFETELIADGPKASYCFDISTNKTIALYELTVINHGRELVNRVFCKNVDQDVMGNIHLIDRAIHALFKQYDLPTAQRPKPG